VPKYVESAKTERNIVKKLNSLDEDNSHHIVRFYESFFHHQFFCLVFEPLGPSLYDLIKKNGHHGYPPRFVQSFARQVFSAIAFMHANSYTHTDLKPENILLVSDIKRSAHPVAEKYYLPESDRVKLIDFGGATHTSDRHSSVINTRQYRSP
jgi:dual-specificity kinase